MAISDDVSALIEAAEAFDTAAATMAPALDVLASAEAVVRGTLVADGIGLRDHLSGGAQLRHLAISLLSGGSELHGSSLASIVTDRYGDLVAEEVE